MEPWEKYQSEDSDGPWAKYGVAAEPSATPAPSALAVAGNAVAKGVAGTIDMFGNAPTNAFNLGQGVIGYTAEALGHPEVWADRTYGTQPNFAHKAMTGLGLIKPENEPQGAGQRILDTAVQGGVSMLANPVKGGLDVARNIAMGVVGGGAAAVTKEATGSDLLALAVGVVTPMVANKLAVSSAANLKNPVGQATFKEAHDFGLVVPPSLVKKQGIIGNRLGAEAIAGKGATIQEANLTNVEKLTAIAKKAIGLPDDMQLTKDNVEHLKTVAAKPFEEANKLSQVPIQTPGMPSFPQYSQRNLLEELKQARHDATAQFNFYNRNQDPATLKIAKAFRAKAALLETQLEMVAKQAGKPELVTQLKASRQLYARIFDVERATNFSDGTINPQVFAKLFDKGKPLSGGLEVIGKFASAFPKVTQPASRVSSPNVSGGDPMVSMAGAMVGGTAGGGVGAMIGAGVPYLRSPARKFVLSDMAQNRLLRDPAPFSESLRKGALIGRSLTDYQEAIP